MINYGERIKRLERFYAESNELKKTEKGDHVLMVYSDGRRVETWESLGIRIQEVEAYMDWHCYFDGIIEKPPTLIEIINLETNERWNLEESARKLPMTDDEADLISQEVMAKANN